MGRIDQFVFGILFARYGGIIPKSYLIGGGAIISIIMLYWAFDSIGGFYKNETYPGIWIWLLTAEGVLYGLIVNWYDRSFQMSETGLSGLIAKIGAASYSIYILHFFWVYSLGPFVDKHVVAIDTIYIALAFNTLFFSITAFIGWLSYRYFESFWFRFQLPYIIRRHPVYQRSVTSSR